MPTRAPTAVPEHPRNTPRDKQVRHSVGNAGQRRVDNASVGQPDGGDWMAERVAPGQPPVRKPTGG